MKTKIFTSLLLAATMTIGMCSTAFASEYDIDGMDVSGITVKFYQKLNPEGGDAESDYFKKKIEEWNAEDNGITIEPVFISVENDYFDRLSTDMASGDAPDVFMQYGGSSCLDYVESGAVLNLTPYLDYDQDWYNGFVSANWAPVDYTKYGYEGVYGAPWSAYEILLYYNQDYLDQCSLEVPKTWDELVSACAVLKENGIQPFMFGAGSDYKFAHNLSVMAAKSYGADFQDKLADREYTYESPEITDLIQDMIDMQEEGYFGENNLSFDANAERSYFGAGDSAFMIDLSRGGAGFAGSGGFQNKTIHAAKFPYFYAEYAGISMGGASQRYFTCTLTQSAEPRQASLKVLKWLTSTDYVDGLVQNYANTYSVIPSTGVIDNYLFEECNNLMGETETYVGELAEASTNTAEKAVVRSALQLIASGSSAEEIGKEIMDNLSNYE